MSAPNPPSSLGSLTRQYLPAYLAGALMLAVFQLCMNRIDWLSKQAIDAIFSSGAAQGAAAAV